MKQYLQYLDLEQYRTAHELWERKRDAFNAQEDERLKGVDAYLKKPSAIYLSFGWVAIIILSIFVAYAVGSWLVIILGGFLCLTIEMIEQKLRQYLCREKVIRRTFLELEPEYQPSTEPTQQTEVLRIKPAPATQYPAVSPTRSVPPGAYSWDTLVIPTELRETLQAYCAILQNYGLYRAQGVNLPKGLLLHGPPGCGKTEIAKTLNAQGGMNFISLSTAEVKVGWIGHAAVKIMSVFSEARDKAPSIIFIDELDAVCPSRGLYNDAISQESTAQFLQEIDGISSDDKAAVFLIGATNRADQIDPAILSRFSEKIQIPLPDEAARRALLTVFLIPMRFEGDREFTIQLIAELTNGQSGRDLRQLLQKVVISAVKRTALRGNPKEFWLEENDFSDAINALAENAYLRRTQGTASKA